MKLKNLIWLTVMLAMVCSGTAMAKKRRSKKEKDPVKSITPYLKIQADLGYVYKSKEASGVGESDLDYYNNLLGTSRVGVKGEQGKIKGNVELGLDAPNNKTSLRHAYGTYNFGCGEVLMGHTWTPYTFLSSMVRGGKFGIGYGATYDPRQNQIKLTMSNAYVSFMDPNTANIAGPTGVIATTNIDTLLPKTALGYEYKAKMFSVGPGLVFNAVQVKEENVPALTNLDGEFLLSWMAYVHGKMNLAALMIKGNLAFGMNTGNLGVGTQYATLKTSGDGFENTKTIEGFVDVGYDLKFVNLVSGIGYLWADNCDWTEKDQNLSLYIQGDIPIEKNLKATPYINYVNKFKDSSGTKEGSEVYVGVFGQLSL
jgi:hypothetical protein